VGLWKGCGGMTERPRGPVTYLNDDGDIEWRGIFGCFTCSEAEGYKWYDLQCDFCGEWPQVWCTSTDGTALRIESACIYKIMEGMR